MQDLGQFTSSRFGKPSDDVTNFCQLLREQAYKHRGWFSRCNLQPASADDYCATPDPIEAYQTDGAEPLAASRGENERYTVNTYNAICHNSQAIIYLDIDMHDWLAIYRYDPRVSRNLCLRLTGFFEHWLLYMTGGGYRVAVPKACNIFRKPDGRVFGGHQWELSDLSGFTKPLGLDSKYVELCQKQECYRARLSPKPWRESEGSGIAQLIAASPSLTAVGWSIEDRIADLCGEETTELLQIHHEMIRQDHF